MSTESNLFLISKDAKPADLLTITKDSVVSSTDLNTRLTDLLQKYIKRYKFLGFNSNKEPVVKDFLYNIVYAVKGSTTDPNKFYLLPLDNSSEEELKISKDSSKTYLVTFNKEEGEISREDINYCANAMKKYIQKLESSYSNKISKIAKGYYLQLRITTLKLSEGKTSKSYIATYKYLYEKIKANQKAELNIYVGINKADDAEELSDAQKTKIIRCVQDIQDDIIHKYTNIKLKSKDNAKAYHVRVSAKNKNVEFNLDTLVGNIVITLVKKRDVLGDIANIAHEIGQTSISTAK